MRQLTEQETKALQEVMAKMLGGENDHFLGKEQMQQMFKDQLGTFAHIFMRGIELGEQNALNHLPNDKPTDEISKLVYEIDHLLHDIVSEEKIEPGTCPNSKADKAHTLIHELAALLNKRETSPDEKPNYYGAASFITGYVKDNENWTSQGIVDILKERLYSDAVNEFHKAMKEQHLNNLKNIDELSKTYNLRAFSEMVVNMATDEVITPGRAAELITKFSQISRETNKPDRSKLIETVELALVKSINSSSHREVVEQIVNALLALSIPSKKTEWISCTELPPIDESIKNGQRSVLVLYHNGIDCYHIAYYDYDFRKWYKVQDTRHEWIGYDPSVEERNKWKLI